VMCVTRENRFLYWITVDGVYSYQTSYGFASGQITRHSQGTLLPSSGEPKVSNPWNNVQRKDSSSKAKKLLLKNQVASNIRDHQENTSNLI
jgi:hypothetical protein